MYSTRGQVFFVLSLYTFFLIKFIYVWPNVSSIHWTAIILKPLTLGFPSAPTQLCSLAARLYRTSGCVLWCLTFSRSFGCSGLQGGASMNQACSSYGCLIRLGSEKFKSQVNNLELYSRLWRSGCSDIFLLWPTVTFLNSLCYIIFFCRIGPDGPHEHRWGLGAN